MTTFPKYKTGETIRNMISSNKDTCSSSWVSPKRYNLRSSQKQKDSVNENIPLRNRYTPLQSKTKMKANSTNSTSTNTVTPKTKHQISQVVHNISKSTLSSHEMSLLEKGLNFCPSTKDVDTEELLDDAFAYCRKLRLKHYFDNSADAEKNIDELQKDEEEPLVQDERCPMVSTYKNPYFNSPAQYTPPNLEKFIAATKTSIADLISKPSPRNTNMTSSERDTMASLKKRSDIVITSADKGGKVVVMDKVAYIKECENQLKNPEFYTKIDTDPTEEIVDEIKTEVSNMLDKNLISKKESHQLTESFEKPRMAIFYGLPKIHKVFQDFPPLRPIVSGFGTITSKLSEYLDTYLKYQARKGAAYIRDTKDFLVKLKNLKSIPKNAILVTMDVGSLYTNIDHMEGADACFKKLEMRRNKTVTSSLLRKLILLVLKSNVFRFDEILYQQIKGTAMGTPMAVNYANLFLENFETEMLNEYERKTKLKPYIWMRYIDDIFFIWQHDEKSLNDFINFCDNYSASKKMKSNIRFETNSSTESVNFLDVKVSIKGEKIHTSLYTKPTDAHLYLNAKSCHPRHVIKNLPKGQFIRVRRICSEETDFDRHAREMMKFFIQRGYKVKNLQEDISLVKKMPREDLLQEKINTTDKDTQSLFVCTWHPKLHRLSSILNENFKIIQNDPKLKSVFKENPTVAFRRKRNLKNILCKNDIRKKPPKEIGCCKGCQLCNKMSDKETITNKKIGVSVCIKPGGCCQSSGVVYAIYCKKCDEIYIGETGKTMAKRWSGHKYDI